MILLLLLLGCAPKPAPPVYATALPALPAPVEPTADECPEVAPYRPGREAPFTDGAGVATCGGLLLPDSVYADIRAAAEIGALCREHRTADRAHCEAVAGQRWDYGEELRRDLRTARWATVGAAVGAVLVGLAIGYGAGSLP